MLSTAAVALMMVVRGHGLGLDELPDRYQPAGNGTQRPNLTPTAACNSNNDCALNRACFVHRCQDPCRNACGINASCRVAKHIPVCRCDEGFVGDATKGCTAPDTTGKKKFEISSFKLNWHAAFMNCQARGMRLATIENKEEDDDFIALMGSGTYVGGAGIIWVGATDLAKEGDWYWMTTGQPILKYKNWINAEPNNAFKNENCMGYWEDLNKIGWCDYGYSNECFFACEYY